MTIYNIRYYNIIGYKKYIYIYTFGFDLILTSYLLTKGNYGWFPELQINK